MITEYQLSAIEARAEKASPEPWFIHRTDDEAAVNALYISNEPGPLNHDQKRGLAEDGPDQVRPANVIAITLLQTPHLCRPKLCDENTEFIAHARSDVPLLVAEIRRLTKRLQEVEQLNSKH
jgi:hypothetical protein